MPRTEPFCSIIVPTRNRAAMLGRALESIRVQRLREFQVVVVDDGSGEEARAATQELAGRLDERFEFHYRDAQEPLHGPNVARNSGIGLARGCYVGFLDDDDYWCDAGHLETARHLLAANPDTDVYICNQVARRDGADVVSRWLPQLDSVVSSKSQGHGGEVYRVRHAELLRPGGIGFAHVNMCLVRRSLLARVGGFWDEALYEGDLNFFLRVMDQARDILYRPHTVAVMELRRGGEGGGVSSINDELKLLFRALACDHARLRCRRREVLRYLRRLHSSALKRLTKHHYQARNFGLAAELALRASAVMPSPKWCLIALALRVRALAAFH